MKNRKHILLALALVAALTTTEGAVINSMAAETDIIVEDVVAGINGDADATINSMEYVWVYKYIGSFLYKRLYNKTTGKYVGDWIPVNP